MLLAKALDELSDWDSLELCAAVALALADSITDSVIVLLAKALDEVSDWDSLEL